MGGYNNVFEGGGERYNPSYLSRSKRVKIREVGGERRVRAEGETK